MRACFAGLTGLHLDANQWAQAARGLAQAGLGLRSTANDGPAAYLASVGGCATACRGLDANYGATGLASHAAVLQAAAAVNLRLPQPVAPHLLLGMKQKSVTVLLDKAGWQQQLASTSVVGRAVLHSEAEPGGRAWLLLLPQRPDDTRVAHRRPADIYLPSLYGTPAALDLAVTAPQRQESLGRAGQQALAAATAYAEVKSSHLGTARVCAEQGLKFVPMVAEATGAWEPEAAKILLLISRAAAAREDAPPSGLHSELLQEMSVLLRSHRARAVLRRRAESSATD